MSGQKAGRESEAGFVYGATRFKETLRREYMAKTLLGEGWRARVVECMDAHLAGDCVLCAAYPRFPLLEPTP